MERFRVRVEQPGLMFSAGHFITLGDGQCEALHGHDYQVAVEVEGPLTEQKYVVDFLLLSEIVRKVIADWDHHVLLPLNHPQIQVVPDSREVQITFQDRRWVLPRSDCRLLPIPNTTSELLARLIALQVSAALGERINWRPPLVRIELREAFGQMACCEIQNSSPAA